VSLDCVIYCAFYSILFRGPFCPGHGVYLHAELHPIPSGLVLLSIHRLPTYVVFRMSTKINMHYMGYGIPESICNVVSG